MCQEYNRCMMIGLPVVDRKGHLNVATLLRLLQAHLCVPADVERL